MLVLCQCIVSDTCSTIPEYEDSAMSFQDLMPEFQQQQSLLEIQVERKTTNDLEYVSGCHLCFP